MVREKQSIHSFPSFSVLMSVYKNEIPSRLQEALTSIQLQTIPPFEVILVKDGPISEKLQEVINDFKTSFNGKFILVNLSKNQGLGAALNAGTKYVRTNWIARVDSDDINLPDRFEKQLKEISLHPELALLGGQVAEYDESLKHEIGYRIVPTTESEIKKYLKWRSPFNHPTVMVRKDALMNAGGYQSFGNFEDYYLWARIIADNCAVKNLSEVLVNMRVSDDLYQRRGNLQNAKYIVALQNYLYQEQLVGTFQYIISSSIKLFNLVISGKLRKFLYRNLIHQKNYRRKE